jgi:hypothetical protein
VRNKALKQLIEVNPTLSKSRSKFFKRKIPVIGGERSESNIKISLESSGLV